MDRAPNLELDRPRSALELLGVTFEVYGRYPLLFFVLAASVVVPYALLLLLATGQGLLQSSSHRVIAQLIPFLDTIVVGPLISALHVHAVREIAEGQRPRLAAVARRAVACLPVVSAVVVISFLGIAFGLVALIVPGVFLWLRWSVAAQAAALDRRGWKDALRSSEELAEGYYLHVFVLLFVVLAASTIIWMPVFRHFRHTDTTVFTFLLGIVLRTLLSSLSALTGAVLYFDLKARARTELRAPLPSGAPIGHGDRPPSGWYIDPVSPKRMRYWSDQGWTDQTTRTPRKLLREWRDRGEEGGPPTVPDGGSAVEPTGHPLDPSSYSDEDRPPGWYVIPDSPWKMRYWAADGTPTWGKRKAKTPKKVLAEWRDTRWAGN